MPWSEEQAGATAKDPGAPMKRIMLPSCAVPVSPATKAASMSSTGRLNRPSNIRPQSSAPLMASKAIAARDRGDPAALVATT